MSRRDDLAASLEMHDEMIARRNVDIWIGAAPTFCRRDHAAQLTGENDTRPRALASADGVEIRLPACASASRFEVEARALWTAAEAAGLSAVRYHDNGDVTETGGAVLSLGGATPATSPFVRYPHVLPAFVRYLNNHPSLSYWFAREWVGSASRGPRADEGTRERWDELGVTLGWLERLADRGELTPALLRQALGPLLVAADGDAQRAEVHVEQLWSPRAADDAPAGIVELRAVRMPEHPVMLAALATLVRSIIARLVVSHYRAPLVDWHDELHDRFALPAALSRDLRMVLGDLDEHGLGIPAQLRRELDHWRQPGVTCRLGDATLTLRPALEFWPVVGDAADASTQRLEISLDGAGPDRIAVAGKWAHLRAVGDGVRAIGVRRRAYQPSPGLHPGLPATDPLVIEWSWHGRTQRIELWAWKPDGGAYPALPADDNDALARRQARIQLTTRDGEATAAGHWSEARPFTIDLRRE